MAGNNQNMHRLSRFDKKNGSEIRKKENKISSFVTEHKIPLIAIGTFLVVLVFLILFLVNQNKKENQTLEDQASEIVSRDFTKDRDDVTGNLSGEDMDKLEKYSQGIKDDSKKNYYLNMSKVGRQVLEVKDKLDSLKENDDLYKEKLTSEKVDSLRKSISKSLIPERLPVFYQRTDNNLKALSDKLSEVKSIDNRVKYLFDNEGKLKKKVKLKQVNKLLNDMDKYMDFKLINKDFLKLQKAQATILKREKAAKKKREKAKAKKDSELKERSKESSFKQQLLEQQNQNNSNRSNGNNSPDASQPNNATDNQANHQEHQSASPSEEHSISNNHQASTSNATESTTQTTTTEETHNTNINSGVVEDDLPVTWGD